MSGGSSNAAGSPVYRGVMAASERFAADFDRAGLAARPSLGLAVLTCMDARLAVEEILGLRPGEAHVIRNAGGLATDDALRSLVLSHHLLATREVLVVEHTECGQLSFDESELRGRLVETTGEDTDTALLPFADLEANLRAQVALVRGHPWLAGVPVHGLIYDVQTGRLREAAG